MRIELSIPQDFLDLLSATGGIFYGDIKNQFIKGICTDSRECMAGDIFFALDGKCFDGNKFICDAIKRGAIPVGRGVGRYGIRVDSGNSALLSFASFYKNSLPRLRNTTAITGSVGKTTTKEFLKILSDTKYKTHTNWGNYNNEIGASLTVLSSPKDTEILILEFGMNHIGEIGKLSSALCPDTAVITKIGSAHIGHLGTREKIADAKLEIISGLKGRLLLPLGENLLSGKYQNTSYFSSGSTHADVAVLKNIFDQLEFYIKGSIYSIFDFPCKAEHILECLSAAIISALEIGLKPDEIIKGISNIKEDAFRHKLLRSKNGYSILDDSYNASYESVKAALAMMSGITDAKRKHALLGDILELGDMSYTIHYSVGEMISASGIHYLFLIGKHAEAVYDGAIDNGFDKERIFMLNKLETYDRIADFINTLMKVDDIILIKASHGLNLGSIVELIR